LGVSISDFNNDGWDDIYVSNDFFEQDYYYINQQDGTFKEKLKEAFGHTSLFSMGNVAGDINLDGNLDLITTDMLPADMKVLKSTINDEPLDIYNLEVKSGFYYQYSRNALQLNVANGKKFVDIGIYSGVSATDWTWSPMIQDFDLDGRKDLFFSNGIKKRLNDLDYLKYLGDPGVMKGYANDRKFDRNKINKMPDGRVPNFLFRGDSALRFADVSSTNDMVQPSASSGAIYVDLDNDGDLEIVTNNMDEPATIYQNVSIQPGSANLSTTLTYSVSFKEGNKDGIGTRFFMKSAKGTVDHQEIQTSTGFQSGQNNNLLFTFSSGDKPAELLIIWPDNSSQVIKQFDSGKKVKITWTDSTKNVWVNDVSTYIQKFIAGSSLFDHQQMDVQFIADLKVSSTPDFNYYSLLPHTYLKHTPAIAVGDLNSDGFDDLYVGGVSGEEKYLLIGQANSGFKRVNVEAFKPYIDIADAEAQWGDLDNDGDLDLVVTNAEHPLVDSGKVQAQRVFLNKGNFNFESSNLPALRSLTSKLALIDYNGDGFKDIFLAGAVYFKNYTKKLPSFLLINDGKGGFKEASAQLPSALADIRFIRDLTVSDLNGDGREDLIVSSEWQPLAVFVHNGRGLQKKQIPVLEKLKGWWQSATVTDLNQDGKSDLIAGNWGLNSKYNVAEGQPLYAYNSDLDKDGKPDLIISYFYEGNHYPFRPKNDLEQELPYLKKEWLSYQKMADKTTAEIFKDRINEQDRLESNTFESVFISDILGDQIITALPYLYQQSPITSGASSGEENKLIINGNYWGAIPYEGRYDALGLATLEYNADQKKFSDPVYWINSQINFSEISYIKKVKSGNKNRWIVLTSEGKLLSVSKIDKKNLLAKN
ncbi:MAG TPA: VCBS repeat-containing protein, partial [Daejeonella sp.]|nr:VCBS repeat-containing protein [Daejeonella sp.]